MPRKITYKISKTGCWECDSHKANADGYFHMMVNGKAKKLHRIFYENYIGEIPKGLVVRHKCDNRGCCNPNHLELGTQYDNIQDAVKRRRIRSGENSVQSNLTEKDIIEIRSSDKGPTELSKIYKISTGAICNIKSGKNWKYVPLLQKPKNLKTKLTFEDIRQIREYGKEVTHKAIAEKFNVSLGHIGGIRSLKKRKLK
jgi:hypothetical protein